jgi:hypothetical protein
LRSRLRGRNESDHATQRHEGREAFLIGFAEDLFPLTFACFATLRRMIQGTVMPLNADWSADAA